MFERVVSFGSGLRLQWRRWDSRWCYAWPCTPQCSCFSRVSFQNVTPPPARRSFLGETLGGESEEGSRVAEHDASIFVQCGLTLTE